MQTKKIPNISGLVKKKTGYNGKITENIAALTAVKNKRPYVINLVKKTDHDAKISNIENKYITTADYNKFTKDIVTNKIKSEGFVDKSAIAGFINNADLNKKVSALTTKTQLKAEQEKIIKLQAFESSYFRDKSHF